MFFFSLCVTDLRWNSIGILGSRTLLSSLKHNNTILHIHLDGNSIPVDILDAFGKVLHVAVFQDKIQPRRQGGIWGSSSEPPFWPPKDFMYTAKLHILSILPFESGPLVSLLLRITAVQTSLVAATVCEFVHGGPARNTRVTCLRLCDERTRVITRA